MAVIDDITKLAQSIYLAQNGRYNDVEGSDLTDFLNKTIDWVNQFIEELEMETNWNYLRKNNNLIATISDPTIQSYALPTTVRTVVVSPYRDVTIQHDGTTIATFTMVNPDQISDPTDLETHDRATVINSKLILSRQLKSTEVGGEIRADTIDFMPKLSLTDGSLLSLVKPKQLLVLGVAKNATLPDIIQGGISPSLAQKYKDLLDKAIAANDATAEALEVPSENFGFIRGVY